MCCVWKKQPWILWGSARPRCWMTVIMSDYCICAKPITIHNCVSLRNVGKVTSFIAWNALSHLQFRETLTGRQNVGLQLARVLLGHCCSSVPPPQLQPFYGRKNEEVVILVAEGVKPKLQRRWRLAAAGYSCDCIRRRDQIRLLLYIRSSQNRAAAAECAWEKASKAHFCSLLYQLRRWRRCT